LRGFSDGHNHSVGGDSQGGNAIAMLWNRNEFLGIGLDIVDWIFVSAFDQAGISGLVNLALLMMFDPAGYKMVFSSR
jgi:hypothetical protein